MLNEKDLTFPKYRVSLAKETKYDLMKKLRFSQKNAKLNTT